LLVLAASLLIAVPALRPVLREIRGIKPLWILGGVGLELASCMSFVTLFRAFFDRLKGRDARALAWANMASGALLPGGGAGGLAIGGWLIHLTGAPTGWIVRRSGGLFFLTTAVNPATVIGAGLLLSAGVARPDGFLLVGLPAVIVTIATAAVIIQRMPSTVAPTLLEQVGHWLRACWTLSAPRCGTPRRAWLSRL
jgi:hypothetical protein